MYTRSGGVANSRRGSDADRFFGYWTSTDRVVSRARAVRVGGRYNPPPKENQPMKLWHAAAVVGVGLAFVVIEGRGAGEAPAGVRPGGRDRQHPARHFESAAL